MNLLNYILLLLVITSCSNLSVSRSVSSNSSHDCSNSISKIFNKVNQGLGSTKDKLLSPGWKLEESDLESLSIGQKNTLRTIRASERIWDASKLNQLKLPIPIASLEHRDIFSNIKTVRQMDVADLNGKATRPTIKVNGIEEEVETSYGHNVRMMLAKLPNEEFLFPKELEQFNEAAKLAVEFFKKNFEGFEDYHLYVSIHQGKVVKDNTQARLGKSVGDDLVKGKRTGAHVDGFQVDVHPEDKTIDHTIMVTDNVATEFFNHPFPIQKTDYQDTLDQFDEMADMQQVVYAQNYALSLIDAYAVHRMGIASSNGERSFIKFKLSKKVFNQQGNTLNPLIDYKKLRQDALEAKQNPLWQVWTSNKVNLSEGRNPNHE